MDRVSAHHRQHRQRHVQRQAARAGPRLRSDVDPYDFGLPASPEESRGRRRLREERLQVSQFPDDRDVKAATAAWEAPAYEIYAFHEVQTIAGECRERGGLHVWDDAFVLEIVDTERGELLPPGEQGDLVVTCLYKSGSPQIRYNIKDLSTLAYGRCDCGSESTRMGRLAGRSDTMVKLRGINVWPEAVGSTMEEVIHGHLEYFCVAHRIGERDEMVVLVEEPAPRPFESSAILEEKLGQAVQSRLGIRLDVQLVSPGSLDQLTGRGTVAKLRQFRMTGRARGHRPCWKSSRSRSGMVPIQRVGRKADPLRRCVDRRFGPVLYWDDVQAIQPLPGATDGRDRPPPLARAGSRPCHR